MAESPKTEKLLDGKGDGFKSENELRKKSAAEKESSEKQGIPGANQVEGKDQSPNIDGASDTNYARVGILAPCSGDSMKSYLRLAGSHT